MARDINKDKQLEGACIFCGQMQTVLASSDEEANQVATENCRCDRSKKARSAKQCKDNIQEICGPNANEYQMDVLDEEVIEIIKDLGSMCVYDNIEAASIRLPDSVVALKQTKDGVAVSRKKALSVRLEA